MISSTSGEEILAGRKFGGNKIWRNWREFNLADAKKCKFWREFNLANGGIHKFWRELNLADKHKIEYYKCFFYQKMIYFLLTTSVYDTKYKQPKSHSSSTI